tara:strand:- start:5283 stop:6023 length:741 start_codon:yes stop_codon:yes gene_type:complete
VRIHRVYCKSVSGPNDIFKLDESQSHHLIKSLRIKINDTVEVFDGEGNSAKCIVEVLKNKKCMLKRIEDISSIEIEKETISAIVPIIKKNNFIFMLQKMSEIGVNHFLIYKPENIDQSVAKKNIHKFTEKSEEIIINVCKQCGNNFLPSIKIFEDLKTAINDLSKIHQIYAFDTSASIYFNQNEIKDNSSIVIITGPESGFSEGELELMSKEDIIIRYLGKNILRSETAPIAVSAIIKNHFGKFEI